MNALAAEEASVGARSLLDTIKSLPLQFAKPNFSCHDLLNSASCNGAMI